MPIKVTKAQIKECDAFLERLAESGGALKEALKAHNDNRGDAAEWVEALTEAWRSEYSDKPERWQVGEKGTAVDEFISAWEHWHLENWEDLEINHIDAARDELAELDETPSE